MAKPTSAEIAKKSKDLEGHLKKLENPDTGQQKISPLITMVRGAIRSSWAMSPIKLAYWEMGREPDNSPSLRKWQMKCECCEKYYKVDEIEIDHRNGNHSFTKPEDFENYFDNILNVTFDDLQRICKYKCHRVKSHMEKKGLNTMQEAAIDKINIFVDKFTETVAYTRWLAVNGIHPANAKSGRKVQGVCLLTESSLSEEQMLDLFEACDYLMRLEAKAKKSKRFVVKQADYKVINTYYELWGLMNLHRPKLNFKYLEV